MALLESITTFLSELGRNIRFADVLDVALISMCLYIGLTWLRRNVPRSVSIAVLLIVMVYGLSGLFQMYLTEQVIKAFLVILIIGSLIIFQADIRRLFDRMAMWRPFWQRSRRSMSSQIIDILTDAATALAKERSGALIVLKGREPWDRQVLGGTELEGMVSKPLLCSIFNPKSPTHDGAVLIEGKRVVKFGAHLPLSTNLHEVGPRGTRHTAALGMSEHSDALVIVVSEERGLVSVAEAGTLTELSSAEELHRRINRFWRQHYKGEQSSERQWWRAANLRFALLSVALAGLFWFIFAYQTETLYRTFLVPIEFRNLPSNSIIQDPVPAQARVTLSGSERAFQLVDPVILAVSFDLSQLNEGVQELYVTEENIKQPPGLDLYQVEPRTVLIRVQRLQVVELPVTAQTEGSLPFGLELVKLTADPQRVKLMIPHEVEGRPKQVLTEPIDLRKITGSSPIKTRLVLPDNARLPKDHSPEVTIHVEVRPKGGSG